MNQFHIDFDMCDEDGNKIKGLQDLCSIEAYFLGKKYIVIHYKHLNNTKMKK